MIIIPLRSLSPRRLLRLISVILLLFERLGFLCFSQERHSYLIPHLFLFLCLFLLLFSSAIRSSRTSMASTFFFFNPMNLKKKTFSSRLIASHSIRFVRIKKEEDSLVRRIRFRYLGWDRRRFISLNGFKSKATGNHAYTCVSGPNRCN